MLHETSSKLYTFIISPDETGISVTLVAPGGWCESDVDSENYEDAYHQGITQA
jgi:hypothetical protein